MKKILALILTLTLVIGLFAGCSQTPSAPVSGNDNSQTGGDNAGGKKLVFGLSLFYRTDEYYMDIENSMKKEAEKLGIELLVQDANTDLSKQIQQIEDFITKKVDAIIMSPCDPVGSQACVEAAKKAGIPIFTYDGIMEDNTDVAGYTTCDFYSDGYKTGQWAKEYIEKNLDGKAKVAILDYPASPIVCGGRADGFEAAVKELEGVEVVARQDGKGSRTDGMTVMENILTANSNDVDVVFAINYESGAGAAAAIEAAKADTIVTCVAWSKEGLEKMEADDPIMKAYMLGVPSDHTKILQAAKDVCEGKTIDKEVTYEYIVVDHDTLDEKVDWKAIIDMRNQ